MLRRGSAMVSHFVGGATPPMTIMPVCRPPPQFGGAARRPLKFNY